MLYVYDPTGPLPTLSDVVENSERGVARLAEICQDLIYFEYVPPERAAREEAQRLAEDFLMRVSNETIPLDIVVQDLFDGINRITW